MSKEITTQQDRQSLVQTLSTSLYVGAKPESIAMVLDYCAAAGLDPMQKPVHIVPMNSKNPVTGQYEWRDVVMPGIGHYRVQADRAGTMAGISEPEFGPEKMGQFVSKNGEEISFTYPEWCRITVKKIVGSIIVEFAAKEYWLENYATDSAKSTAPNKMWTKRPRGQIAKCFDENTEVLTENGFKKFSEVNEKIMQVTSNGIEPVEAKPFVQDYDGVMIEANGTRLNFSVTPNHDMITNLGKIEAKDLYEKSTADSNKISIPIVAQNTNPDYLIGDDVLRLIGYYLADGAHTGYKQFRIAVSVSNKIYRLLKTNLHQKMSIKADAGRVAYIGNRKIITTSDKQCFTYSHGLIEEFVDHEKKINLQQCLKLSRRQARIIIDSLVEFDGSDNGNGTMRLTQRNQNVISSFEVLSQIAGYSISKSTRNEGIFNFTVSKKSKLPVTKGVSKNKASLSLRFNEQGKVWCVTVPSGEIIVRRNGFSMVVGNCAEAQALRKAFPDIGAQPTAEEMEGKIIDINSAPDSTPATAESFDVLRELPEDQFQEYFPNWQEKITSGQGTADQLISKLESMYSLTEEQIARIRQVPEPTDMETAS
jgi:phage recombination protein Bet